MPFAPTPLERAFALARTGDYAQVGEIRHQLEAEGFGTAQLSGPSLLKQLRVLCVDARRKHAQGSQMEEASPGDVIGASVMVVKIAAGEIEDRPRNGG